MSMPILKVNGLKKYFPIEKGFIKHVVGNVKAVDGIDFEVNDMETVGLVGESGCGKSTTGNCIVRLLDPTGGEILFRKDQDQYIDLATIPLKEMKPYRSQIQMIFQDPYSSLNPRMTVHDIIAEPIRIFSTRNKGEVDDKVTTLMRKVGLHPEYMIRYPHAFSGGQRQRIGIARALSVRPRLVVADEPVSALDVSVQAQILNLLLDLQQRLSLTYIFVAHNLGVVKHICDRVAVMYVGKLVELAKTGDLFHQPRHPYTAALMAAVPVADPRVESGNVELKGEVPSPANPPSGCYFHPRCAYAADVCRSEPPGFREISPGHFVACHRSEEIELPGISLT